MGAVKSLCTKGVLLRNGRMHYAGDIESTIEQYLTVNMEDNQNIELSNERTGTGDVIFADFRVENSSNQTVDNILTGEDVTFIFTVKVNKKTDAVDLGFSLHDVYGVPLTNIYNSYQDVEFNFDEEGYHTIRFKMKDFPVSLNNVLVKGLIKSHNTILDWPGFDLGKIQIGQGDFYKIGRVRTENYNVQFLIKGEWERSKK